MTNDGQPMRGKVAVVTGANSGLGKHTALRLAQQGAQVVCVCRDEARGRAAVEELRAQVEGATLELVLCDLSSMASIRAAAEQLTKAHPVLHVLVNNAGVVNPTRQTTADGLEATFALNHLGYFLLTHLLLDALKAGAPSRIVNVSSEAEMVGTIDFDDLQSERRYVGFRAYAQSKLANVMFTYALARRLAGTRVTVNAVHPGPTASGFGGQYRGFGGLVMKVARLFMRSIEKGARTIVFLASSPEVEGKTGGYWADDQPIRSIKESYDEARQERLWQVSEQLAGLAAPPPMAAAAP